MTANIAITIYDFLKSLRVMLSASYRVPVNPATVFSAMATTSIAPDACRMLLLLLLPLLLLLLPLLPLLLLLLPLLLSLLLLLLPLLLLLVPPLPLPSEANGMSGISGIIDISGILHRQVVLVALYDSTRQYTPFLFAYTSL
jgi:hypothetical protein